MVKRICKLAAVLAPAVLAVGCATRPSQPYDYRAFEASNPRSILVLPPLNNSPDVKATESVYSSVTYPLAEAGYYVMPVSVVNETFKQNGLTVAADIHNVGTDKLRQIFGADAALYMTVDKFGSSYNVVSSVVTVAAKAKLVDLRTGALLWGGEVTVVDDGNQGGNNGGGLIGLLVKAAVTQILNSSLNRSHEVAARANAILLGGGQARGVLYGPRSPHYKGRDGSLPVASEDTAPRQVDKPATTASVQPAPAAPVAVQLAPAPVAAAVDAPPPVAAIAPASARNAQLSAEEQRYEDLLSRARSRHQALDPSSAWYRQDLYDWLMARKGEFIRAGKKPDVALQLALAALEGK